MENKKTTLVITSINSPSEPVLELSKACVENDWDFVVVGDTITPDNYNVEGLKFYSVDAQECLDFKLVKVCHKRSYTRKNIGYLIAMMGKAECIVETDDDNTPADGFFNKRICNKLSTPVSHKGWFNVYKLFTDNHIIWPRGLPLDDVSAVVNVTPESKQLMHAPIQQGLADGNPDVDAVYRLLFSLPFNFKKGESYSLAAGTWCPFNSQNTTWFPESYPLMYLPTTCSFRMTDIWRSFVAQRIAWTCGWEILFHEATLLQIRNPHDLMRDFKDEVSGYLNNKAMASALEGLSLKAGREHIFENLQVCYEELVRKDYLKSLELELLSHWISDVKQLEK